MDLQSLRAAVAPLTQFGSEELTFEVEGTTVTLRPLLPKEEIAAQQYAAAVLAETQEEEGLGDEDPLTRAAALRYFDQFRSEIVAYSLVQIGDTDLRGVTTVETGEVLEDGVTQVKVPKHVALRGIIQDTWSRGMITVAFSRYGDLVAKIAERADKIAQSSLADLDAEIARVEARLESLREERERRAKGDPSVTTQQITSLVAAGKALEREIDETLEVAQADRRAAEAIRDRALAEAEAIEKDDSPEDIAPEPEEVATPTPAPPRKSVIPDRVPPPSPKVKRPEFLSSFEDPEENPHALDAEAARIAMARRQAASASRSDLEGDPLSQAKQIGSVRGPRGEEIPTYQLPSETISARGREKPEPGQKPKTKKIPVDPDPRKAALNPNFKPSGE